MPEILRVNGVSLLRDTTVVRELLTIDTTVREIVTIGGQGPAGPRGPIGPSGGNAVTAQAAYPLGGQRLVLLNGDGLAEYASADNVAHALIVLGMTVGAVGTGESVDVIRIGDFEQGYWNWTLGAPVYLGLNGVPTQTLPPEAVFSLVIGFPITSTRLFISIREPIILV